MVNMDNYEQQSIFGFPEYKITKKIRLIEMFGGIGSQAMALRDIGADFEHYRLIEFDKYCVQSYNAIHHTNFVPMDIRDVHGKDLDVRERERYCYILTYSFPCTDLSVAGQMKGMSKEDWKNGESTRSGLLWEVERILKELPKEELPDVLLMENVPMVHNDQNANDFMAWQDLLNSLGYFNFIKDLNAKDFGIPQNRERCFMVSILSDDFISYEFPKPVKLNSVMRDFLETNVDDRYYIKNLKAQKLIKELIDNGTLRTEQNRTEQNRTEQNRTEQNRTSVPFATNFVNNRDGKQKSELQGRLSSDRLCSNSSCEGLQGSFQLCENECSSMPVFFRGFRGKKLKPELRPVDIASTLTCHGDIQNLGTNGVIEWQE